MVKLDMVENFNLCMWIVFYIGVFLSYFIGWVVVWFYLKCLVEDVVVIGFCCLFLNLLLLGILIMEWVYGVEVIVGNVVIIVIYLLVLYMFGIIMMEIVWLCG